MANIVGRWKATHRQATLGVTPVRKLNPGDIADLIINADGTAYMEKKKMFGRIQRERGTWYRDGQYYIIELPDAALLLHGVIADNGEFITRWSSFVGAIDGMGITYRRT